MNLLDEILSKVDERVLANERQLSGYQKERQIAIELLLFLYVVKKFHQDSPKWYIGGFPLSRRNCFYLYKVCAFSYKNNRAKNLFDVFDKWIFASPSNKEKVENITWSGQPRPANLSVYMVSHIQGGVANSKLFHAKFLYLKEIMLEPDALIALIAKSKSLAPYVQMIDLCCKQIDDLPDQKTLPIPPKCTQKGVEIWRDNIYRVFATDVERMAYDFNVVSFDAGKFTEEKAKHPFYLENSVPSTYRNKFCVPPYFYMDLPAYGGFGAYGERIFFELSDEGYYD